MGQGAGCFISVTKIQGLARLFAHACTHAQPTGEISSQAIIKHLAASPISIDDSEIAAIFAQHQVTLCLLSSLQKLFSRLSHRSKLKSRVPGRVQFPEWILQTCRIALPPLLVVHISLSILSCYKFQSAETHPPALISEC